ncbi:unnamed protein product [Rotaria socialis]|uniref:Uncharacterized protein n=1 Tax=Rotaria socialis TaxID=392032 RepID=A0A817X130_9BILA|nr:unnamed protein product [Rotaria socialis]
MKTTTSEISKPYIYINTNGSLSHKLNKRVEGSIKNIGHIENESDKLNEKNERMIEEDKTSNESYQQNFNTNANSIPIVVNSTNSHSNCIKDKSHLLKLIKYRIAQINRLDESGNIETSKTLAKTVETLPRRLLLGGMVIDPLIEEKYFISTGCLKGGGARPSKSSNVKNHRRENLCCQGEDAFQTVKNELDLLRKARNSNRMSRIVIKNESEYSLVYKNHGKYSGFFSPDAKDAFHFENKRDGQYRLKS